MYVFDTSSFMVLQNYFPTSFRTFWEKFDALVRSGKVVSCSEVQNEMKIQTRSSWLAEWAKKNRRIFLKPDEAELKFVQKLFKKPHFQQLVGKQQTLKGTPVADPFVVAVAAIRHATVVTEEAHKQNAARIPNACSEFGIKCINVETFIEEQGWSF